MNYPYATYGQASQPYPQNQQAASYTCRPVTSREEAIAMPTNFTSAGDIMPDIAHGVIYFKRFNPTTGTSDFVEFKYAPPEPPQKPQEYATVQMLNDALEELRSDIAALNKSKKKASAEE